MQRIKSHLIISAVLGLSTGLFIFYWFVTPGLPVRSNDQVINEQINEVKNYVATKNFSELENFDVEANRLYLPGLKLMEKVYVSNNPQDVDLGVWLENRSTPPDQGGNTVLTAHRWGRKTKNPFYDLDKIKVGDEVQLFWQNQIYHYQVREIKVVEPDAVEILAPTDKSQLTLYTCTPLFSDAQRLVVVADLVKVEMIEPQ